jgi:uncharacterized protein
VLGVDTPNTAEVAVAAQHEVRSRTYWLSLELRDDTRVASLRVLGVAFLIYLGAVLWLLFAVLPSGVLQAIAKWSHGTLSVTLLINGILLLVVVPVLCGWGRLTLRELGLRPAKLYLAARVTLALWVLLNLGAAAWQVWVGSALQLGVLWQRPGATWMLGDLLGQLLGNALCEEVLFRAVLLRQAYWHLTRVSERRTAMVIALLVSQALFAGVHGFTFLSQGATLLSTLAPLAKIMAAGCAFGLLYLASGSLLVTVGVHALANTPTVLVDDPYGYDNLPLLIALCGAALVATHVFGASAVDSQYAAGVEREQCGRAGS